MSYGSSSIAFEILCIHARTFLFWHGCNDLFWSARRWISAHFPQRAIMLFNRNLATCWRKTSLRASISWMYSIWAPILKSEILIMWAYTQGLALWSQNYTMKKTVGYTLKINCCKWNKKAKHLSSPLRKQSNCFIWNGGIVWLGLVGALYMHGWIWGMSSSETARFHERQSSDQDKLAGLHIITLSDPSPLRSDKLYFILILNLIIWHIMTFLTFMSWVFMVPSSKCSGRTVGIMNHNRIMHIPYTQGTP